MPENGIFWRGGELHKWEMRIYFFNIGSKIDDIYHYHIEFFNDPEKALQQYKKIINERIDERYRYLYGV